jgi:hypothetical protein
MHSRWLKKQNIGEITYKKWSEENINIVEPWFLLLANTTPEFLFVLVTVKVRTPTGIRKVVLQLGGIGRRANNSSP